MRYINKKGVIVFSLIIAFLLGRVILFNYLPISKYTMVVNPLFWMFMAILTYLLSRDEATPRMRNKLDIIQSVIIIMIIYSMIYFSMGLFFGYEKSPYSHSILSIIKNIWSFVVIIHFQEYTRFQTIKIIPKKISVYAILTILFFIAEIDFWNFSDNFNNNADTFKYISQTILPLFVSNCLFTYLATTSGHISSVVYRGVIALLLILLPIYPSINWLIKSMIDIILVVIVALYVSYSDLKSSRRVKKRELKKESIVSYIPFVIILVVIVCFVGGMFKYQPIAVLSNSMYPVFSRGDAVVIEKIDKKNLKKLKKDTILYYSKDGKLVIHRIIGIEFFENDRVEIITKGDNNNAADTWIVTNDEIIGTVKFMVPYVGYPSVFIYEMLKK